MLPVLFSIGPISISSFGFFLVLAFVFSTFLVWRLARAWDIDEEKILDLIILTFFGGLLGARLYFVAWHFEFFSQDFLKTILLNKYPGFSFWGGVLGGLLSLYLFVKRFKMDFLQIADIFIVGAVGGLIMGEVGCLLGGCDIGNPNNLFFSVPVVGLLGKRFPVQLLESALFIVILFRLWPMATHFQPAGKVLGLGMIYIGIVKLIGEFFRPALPIGNTSSNILGFIFSATLIIFGIVAFYKSSKRNIIKDVIAVILFPYRFLFEGQFRQSHTEKFLKNWYNIKVNWSFKLRNFSKKINVKHTS